MTKDGTKEGIEKFDALIWAVPAQEKARATASSPPPGFSKEEQANEFLALAARRGVLPQQPQ